MEHQTLGRYEIKRLLGRGGMATVYLALDPRFQREVAVKVLPRAYLNDPLFRARFQREAQTVAALEHPAIVPVHDFGEEDGRLYLVMAYMPGGSLADRLQDGPLSPQAAARVLRRISAGLDQAHKMGIVHRDLKPANILFDRYDNAYLSDFGIVKLAQSTSDLTGESVIGTPSFMSPEQAHGDEELDGRSDIYALGAILYTMLCGKPPYDAETPIGVLVKHISEPVPQLAKTTPNMAPFDGVVQKAMAKAPQDRYATANDLVLDLDRVVGAQAASPQAAAIPQAGPPIAEEPADTDGESEESRSPIARWVLAAGALFVVACIAGLVFGALSLPSVFRSPGEGTATATATESVVVIPEQTPDTPTPDLSTATAETVEIETEQPAVAPGALTATPTATVEPPTETPQTPTATAEPELQNGPIVFDSEEDIFIMNADGSGMRRLMNTPARDDEADVSSDGRFIAFETDSGGERVIMIVDLNGRSPRELVPGRQPDWSPDDRFIAFESVGFPQQIYIVETATGEVRQVTDTLSHSRAPSWSPDGEQLAFMTEVGSNWQLAIVDVNSGLHREITTGAPDKRFPVWSPDGELIAYNTLSSTGAVDQIWVVEPSGENARRLTGEGQNGRPAWSPDGEYLLFNSNRDGSWQVFRMDRDGGNQIPLTTTGDAQRADWGNARQ